MSKRIKWLDFGKGFAIFCVVLYHCFQFSSSFFMPIFINFISSFIMPIFFGISGYLYTPVKSSKDYVLLIYKKVAGFLIPYSIFTVIIYYYNKMNLLPAHLGGHHFNNIIFAFINHPFTYLWFLYILFFIFILIGSVNYICITHNKLSQILIGLFIILLILFIQITINVTGFVYWLVCFCIGYLLKHLKDIYGYILNNTHGLKYLMVIIWIIVFYIQIMLEKTYNISSYYGGSDFFNKYDIFTKFLSIPVFFLIFIIISKHNNFIFKYFSKCGKYTLFVYLFHFPVILLLGNVFKELITSDIIMSISLCIITWMICIFMFNIIIHIKLLNYVFYPRKYLDKKIGKNIY